MEIWHNPRCTKSRETLALLEDAGVTPVVRRYLDDPPSVEELDATLHKLGIDPWKLVRRGEDAFKTLGMGDWGRDKVADRTSWIEAMVANPKLIERPVVIAPDGRAVIGRPPTLVNDLLR